MTLTIDLTPEQEARLRRTAEARGVTEADVVRALLEALPEPAPPDRILTIAEQEVAARYDRREITQGQGAGLLGVSRAEFLDILSAARVSPFQYDSAEELIEEALRG